MRTSVSLALFLAAVGACGGHSGLAYDGTPINPGEVDSTQWVAHLEPERMGSSFTGVFGVVHLGPGAKAGNSHAEVSLLGAPIGAELPWIIRSGRCGDVDARDLGLTASYRWLDVRGDGTASLKVELPALVIEGDSHVDVLAGPGRTHDIVACGELAPVL
jgi:hypothetical protein